MEEILKVELTVQLLCKKLFKEELNIKIPRTTALQSKVGKEISKSELEMGDLVFFKTGYKVRHVGIYLEGGKFMHASTKRGVTISRLDNNYYKKQFLENKKSFRVKTKALNTLLKQIKLLHKAKYIVDCIRNIYFENIYCF